MFGDTLPSGAAATVQDDPVIVAATAPANPTKGMAWLNSGNGELNVWDGGAWVVISAQGPSILQPTQQDQLLKATAALQWGLSNNLDGGRF
jgi:hypothetical protein